MALEKQKQVSLVNMLAVTALVLIMLVTVTIFLERTFKFYGMILTAVIVVLVLLWLYRFLAEKFPDETKQNKQASKQAREVKKKKR